MEDNNTKSSGKTGENDVRKCKTCKTVFPNVSDYADHLESKEHIKNAMKMKYGEKYLKAKLKLEQGNQESSDVSDSYNSESSDCDDVYTCETCKKVCTGLLNYKLHLNGKSHKKMLKKKKMLQEMKGMKQASGETTVSKDDNLMDMVFSDTKFVSSDIVCKTCNKRFNGPENFKQHMKSDAHKKKLSMENLTENLEGVAISESKSGTKYYKCDVCDKKLSSPELYKQHVESNGHLKKKLNAEAISKMEETGFHSGDEFKMKCEICQKHFSGIIPLQEHLESSNHKKQEKKNRQLNELCKNHPEIQVPSNAKSENSDDDTLIICSICHVPFSGPESALDHVTSVKHKRAAKYQKFKEKKLKKKDKGEINNISYSGAKQTNSNKNSSGEEFEVI